MQQQESSSSLGLVAVRREEIANCLTHGAGLLLSVFGAVILVVLAAARGDTWQLVGCSVYGATLIAMYMVSTFYHGLDASNLKDRFQTVDHVCIYVFIAGTYTPFTLVPLRGPWGWCLLTTIWLCAAIGTWCKLNSRRDRGEALSVATYVVMGWLCLIAAKPLLEHVPVGGLTWLFAGGALYTAGVVFYIRDHNRYFHAIWHVFVLGGSCCHYLAILLYVAPSN